MFFTPSHLVKAMVEKVCYGDVAALVLISDVFIVAHALQTSIA